MRVDNVMLAIFAVAGVWSVEAGIEATTVRSYKLCGRRLSDVMSRICQMYNSPSWDDPKEGLFDPETIVRRKRQLGIADQCCSHGCTWDQLTDYCAISNNSEAPLDLLDQHFIENRSAEAPTPPGVEVRVNAVARAAPVVGTVSPQVTWGSLHADLVPDGRDRYDHIAIFAAH